MSEKKNELSLDQEAKKLIETLDKLAYEKPAGYQGFLAVCGSAMKIADFRSIDEDDSKSKK
jgi:hypothetical protein